MRQAYLEIGLIYLYSSGLVVVRSGSFIESVGGDSITELNVSLNNEKKVKKQKVNIFKMLLKLLFFFFFETVKFYSYYSTLILVCLLINLQYS